MKNIINMIKSWWEHLWTRQTEAEPAKKKITRKQRDRFHYGAHYYLTDLLDQMDRAFSGMDALKKADPQAYKRFLKMSCNVFSKHMLAERGDEKAWADVGNQFSINVKDIPSQGCVYVPANFEANDDNLYPLFIYFHRMKKPINVQQSNGVIVEIGMCWANNDTSKPVADVFWVSVAEDGSVTPLKELVKKAEKVDRKIKRKGIQPFTFYRASWEHSEVLKYGAGCRHETIEQTAYWSLWTAINCTLAADSGINVRVMKGARRLTFAIDMLRTPYFFKDREKVVNENGNTKKIFHIVAAHKRVVNGVEQIVKSHTRGLRKFMWNGYRVNILLLQKHIKSINTWSADGINEIDVSPEEIKQGKFIEEGKVMERVSKYYDHA